MDDYAIVRVVHEVRPFTALPDGVNESELGSASKDDAAMLSHQHVSSTARDSWGTLSSDAATINRGGQQVLMFTPGVGGVQE